MTTVSAARSTRNRRRVHSAVGTAAAVIVAAATVSVGAQFVGVTPPASDTAPYCAGAYQCQQPGTDGLLPRALDPLVLYGPATWNSATPSGPVASPHTGGAV
ncbi:MAG: hypothetical protein JWQ86_1718 [Mycobacterium sp.]|jgi:hypothetical protein|nr:hypothetical protein [Mycobacterium sp.]